jgi:hypothetical protein
MRVRGIVFFSFYDFLIGILDNSEKVVFFVGFDFNTNMCTLKTVMNFKKNKRLTLSFICSLCSLMNSRF